MKVIYSEVLRNDVRRLNWRAMNYFVKRGMYYEAAICRDRVKTWDSKGPR